MQKEKIQQVVAALPEDVDVDALVEKLYLLQKLEVAEAELAQGKGLSHQQVQERIKSWLE